MTAFLKSRHVASFLLFVPRDVLIYVCWMLQLHNLYMQLNDIRWIHCRSLWINVSYWEFMGFLAWGSTPVNYLLTFAYFCFLVILDCRLSATSVRYLVKPHQHRGTQTGWSWLHREPPGRGKGEPGVYVLQAIFRRLIFLLIQLWPVADEWTA